MSDVEMETAEASAEAPATETDYTAEMAQTFDRLNPPDELAKVSHESELTKYSDDYNASEEPTESTEAQPIDGIQPPQSWNAKAKEHWNSLPREAQEYIAERELQSQQKITEQGRQLYELQRGAHPMPHMEHVQRIAQEHGLTPDDTIQRFVAADHLLKTNPGAAIQYLAQAHGVDLGQFAGDPQQQQVRQMQAQQMEQMRSEYFAMASTARGARAALDRRDRSIRPRQAILGTDRAADRSADPGHEVDRSRASASRPDRGAEGSREYRTQDLGS